MNCQHCGHFIDDGSDFCGYCGHRIESVVNKISSLEKGSLVRCEKCGSFIDDESDFCGYCGYQIERVVNNQKSVLETYSSIICERCGNFIDDGTDFCGYCGQRIGNTLSENDISDGKEKVDQSSSFQRYGDNKDAESHENDDETKDTTDYDMSGEIDINHTDTSTVMKNDKKIKLYVGIGIICLIIISIIVLSKYSNDQIYNSLDSDIDDISTNNNDYEHNNSNEYNYVSTTQSSSEKIEFDQGDYGSSPSTGFYLSYKGTDIRLYTDVYEILPYIGDYSVIHSEDENKYVLQDVDMYITTYPDTNYMDMICIEDKKVATNEGIKIGDSKKKVLKTYGEDYFVEKGDVYFLNNGTMLIFKFNKKDKISKIVYCLGTG